MSWVSLVCGKVEGRGGCLLVLANTNSAEFDGETAFQHTCPIF